jgi:hypothetical protein
MSNYKCLAIEYPLRVLEAWEAHLNEERDKGRETSFTLACLSLSVGVVLELLGMVRSNEQPDPKRNPMGQFVHIDSDRREEFKDTWRKPFVKSPLNPADGSFRYRPPSSPLKEDKLKIELESIDNWKELLQPPATSPSCAQVLEIIRHASAHGGIYAGKSKQIDRVVLLNFTPSSGPTRRVGCVAFSSPALEDLVRKWKALLHKLLPVQGV